MPLRIASLVILVFACGSQSVQAETEEQLVEQAFNGYKSAIMNDQGEAAADLLSSSTVDYYEDMRDLALYAPQDELRQQSTGNLAQALLMRYQIPAQELRNMSGHALLVYAVAHGWVGKNSVAPFTVSSVQVVGSTAVADIVSDRQSGMGQFRFQKEDGSWKLDLVPLMQAASVHFDNLVKQQGGTRERFILSMIAAASGRQVDPSIWEPPLKRTAGQSSEP